jgi:hypothetical protein
MVFTTIKSKQTLIEKGKAMKQGKINLYMARSFSVGFTVHSPTLNGVCFEIFLGCFGVRFWGKGETLLSVNNYWKKQF